ncbi:MazG-like family protein [Streptomyces sp. NPDC058108]|uniref:MazG-like family protein n=1 Tax=Streptomyces sp. NPDC058108 TaxID=3346344 RepID=UPI0036EC9B32
MADEDVWDSIDRLYEWLDGDGDGDGTGDAGSDAGRPRSGREELLLRILKLSEEVGEVAQAVIGATGQNPRKGTTHTWDDVRSELCDVVITGLVALRTLAPDAREVFTAHLAGVTERSLGTGRGPGRPG